MNIKILQEKLFDMLVMFDGICKKHNIRYFLDSGCAIGAVREHDFIPWDDDIDIAVMREDYIKLREILKKELPSHYKLVEPHDYAPYFYDFICKLIDLDVPLRNETEQDRAYHNYQNRISIDFVILDSVPDSKFIQSIIKFRCKLLYGMARSKRYDNNNKNMDLQEKIASSVCRLLGTFFNTKTLIDLYLHNTMKYSGKDSHSLIRSNSLLYYVDFYGKELYKNTVEMDFHGKKFPLPAEYDRILTQMYGDYMTPAKDYKGYISHTDNQS